MFDYSTCKMKEIVKNYRRVTKICDTLRDLVPFVQFKNVKNTHGGVLLLVKLQAEAKSNTSPWVFFTFLNCKNGTKSLNTPHIS